MKPFLLAGATAFALTGCATMENQSPVASSANDAAAASTEAIASPAVPSNVLLAEWAGLYGGVPPWDRVTPELFPEALQFAIDEQRREVLAIANSPAAPTFANTVEALEKSGRRLRRVLSIFGVMTGNVTTPDYQALDREWSPKLSAASDAIRLNPALFARIKAVHEGRASGGLDARQQRLATRLHDQFVRGGANLDEAGKARLSQYNQQLATLFSEFGEKVLADETTYIAVADEAELAGVPQSVRDGARAAAAERKLPAGRYAIVNTRSAVDPILTFGTNRALRERVWRAFVERGDGGGANDTNATIAKIVKLRADRARLLGYPTHAHWRMQDTMAKTPAAATNLMMRVWPAAVARVGEEVRDMQAIAAKERTADRAGVRIEPWDYRFYAEKVRKARYDLDQDQIRPYFELNNMIDAAFWSAGELYDLDFKEITGTVPAWHPDVRAYEVTDRRNGRNVGVFYRDDFARTGKRSGAWATTFRSQQKLDGPGNVLGSNNNNFAKASAGQPTLLSVDDATTLFHEFGHAIHFFLQDVNYPGLAGTPRDFVEYPSQVNENWLLTRPVLDRFAKHHQTKAAMPQALVDKILTSAKFNEGFATTEYLSSALVDMALHTKPDGVVDPDAFERATLASLGMPREVVMRHRLPQFNHLFSSDAYSAGYYSYLWSETMDADTWAAFTETGNVFDKATATRFRNALLSTGNETDRAEAYRAFRGRDPDVDALLKKRGFPTK